MSFVSPVSPRMDHNAFLPHSRQRRTPPVNFVSLPSPATSPRPRSTTLTSLSPQTGPSRSAPTSPMSRPFLPGGLTPLSSISRIDLDPLAHALPILTSPNFTAVQYPQHVSQLQSQPSTQPRPQQVIYRQHPSQPLHLPPVNNRPLPPPTFPPTAPAARTGRRESSRSQSRSRNPSSSSDDTDSTEMDSDSTFVPGRVKHHRTHSQPDLSALRSRLVGGWADGVMRKQMEGKRKEIVASAAVPSKPRPPSQCRKTPPGRSAPLSTNSVPVNPASTSPGRSSHSKSQPSLFTLRPSVSPRQSASSIPRVSPLTSRINLGSSPDDSPAFLGRYRSITDGLGSSEDADDDYDGTDSPSSGSLTFSPKRIRGLRQRSIGSSGSDKATKFSQGLGLSLVADETEPVDDFPTETTPTKKPLDLPTTIERILQRSSLLSLRLLAIVPSLWGICVLFVAFVSGGLTREVWPWGVDVSREALERLVQQHGVREGTWKPVLRGDMVIAMAWAICTAHFCFSLTTGLTHRWRSYYSLPSTITRLISLQCLCWPMTYLTLSVLGADRVLLAWVVIGVTTGWSRTVQMWVTSNVFIEQPDWIPLGINGKGDGGDITPGSTRRVTGSNGVGMNGKVRSPNQSPHLSVPDGLTSWETFTWGRSWDWDNVAREVGWKVGALLLITTAWLFWGIEVGMIHRDW